MSSSSSSSSAAAAAAQEVRGHLEVTAIGTRGLPSKVKGEAYVTFNVLAQKIKTKTVKLPDGEWNFTFKVQLPAQIPVGALLRCELYMKRIPTDTCLGRTDIRLEDVAPGSEVCQWFGMCKKKSEEAVPGEMRLKVHRINHEEKVTKDDFKLLAVVGKGKFGKVMQVQKIDSGQIYAMKVLRKELMQSRSMFEHLKQEANIMKMILHPFTVTLRYSFQDDANLYFIMDYVPGGELFFHLRKEGAFSESRVRFYIAELVLAFEHLHQRNVIYRDLKPENILLDRKGHIRLTDFGLSKEVGADQLTNTVCGTSYCFAPELLRKTGYGKDVDWWALGILMYEMLTGMPPFYCDNKNQMFQKILFEEPKIPKTFSQDATSLLRGLLTKDPARRLGAGRSDARSVRAHPWFNEIDWEQLYRKEIKAPFRPKLKDDYDLSMFDKEFTREAPAIDDTEGRLEDGEKFEEFENFSFVNNELAEGLTLDD